MKKQLKIWHKILFYLFYPITVPMIEMRVIQLINGKLKIKLPDSFFTILGIIIGFTTSFLVFPVGTSTIFEIVGRTMWTLFFVFTGYIIDAKRINNLVIKHIENNYIFIKL